jgi:PAS domain S-box-containing protein
MNRSIHLLDLIDKAKLEEILRAFTTVSGVASIITNVDGSPITKPHNFTSLCQKYSRFTRKGRLKCYESDRYGGLETAKRKKCLIYTCLNAGILDCGAPIIVEGYHVATILCGQVLEKPIERDIAVQRARSIGVRDIEGYLEALKKIPIMSRARLRAIVNLMEVITKNVSELALQKYLFHKHSQHYLNNLINSVTDCIVSTDADLMVSRINKAGAAMFNRKEEDLIGQSILRLLSEEDAKAAFHEKIESRLMGNFRAEFIAERADKTKFPIDITLSKIRDNQEKNSGYVAVIRDITEKKQMERAKEDLIGMLTHDMQNPVLSIQKAIQLMVDGMLGPLTQNQIKVMNLSLGTSHQLLGMVTDFLDIYRKENGRFVLHKLTFNMNQILDEGIRQLGFIAQDKRISIHSDLNPIPSVIIGDRNRLMRTFHNLLDNAIKFSPEKSEVKVESIIVNGKDGEKAREIMGMSRFSRLRSDKKYVLVTVSDQGNGIPKAHQKDIFSKFFTVKSRSGNGRKGLGLGLSFCKLVVEAHGGFIWVKSPIANDGLKGKPGCRLHFIVPMRSDSLL